MKEGKSRGDGGGGGGIYHSCVLGGRYRSGSCAGDKGFLRLATTRRKALVTRHNHAQEHDDC
jgi:hypothetical protein